MRTALSVSPPVAVALMATAIFVSFGASVSHAAPPAPPPAPTIMTPAAPETPDERARDLFLAQRYREALEIYQRLRFETHHPTYLRNIGRCHQMLRQPAPAIDAFERYLREVPELTVSERGEVEGYLAEMRQLATSPRLAANGVPPGAATRSEANQPAGARIGTTDGAQAPASADPESSPSILRRWWFWTGVAAVVVATSVVVAVASTGADRLPCPTGGVCR